MKLAVFYFEIFQKLKLVVFLKFKESPNTGKIQTLRMNPLL
jgi:hypothetical protein